MASLSRRMLAAARLADWPLLIELGQQRDAVEAQLHGERAKQLVIAVLARNPTNPTSGRRLLARPSRPLPYTRLPKRAVIRSIFRCTAALA
jgi:hypothetical protein